MFKKDDGYRGIWYSCNMQTFGYSGGHFHQNWRSENVRRLVTQGILWTAQVEVPPTGAAVEVADKVYALPQPDQQSPAEDPSSKEPSPKR